MMTSSRIRTLIMVLMRVVDGIMLCVAYELQGAVTVIVSLSAMRKSAVSIIAGQLISDKIPLRCIRPHLVHTVIESLQPNSFPIQFVSR